MFDPGEPRSGTDLRAALRRLDEEGEAYLRGMPAAEFFQPQGRAWSPAEHMRHLAKSARPVAKAMGWPRLMLLLAFGPHFGPSSSFAALRERYLARLAAGATAGRFAPTRRPVPEDVEAGKAAVLREWREANAGLEAAAASWSERALDRCRMPHPVLGKLTVREMLAFTALHTAHHLNRVAERRGAAVGS
jgi:hypothetical protein